MDDEAITKSVAEQSNQAFARKHMSLSKEGTHVITKEIKRWFKFNKLSIDNIAKGGGAVSSQRGMCALNLVKASDKI